MKPRYITKQIRADLQKKIIKTGIFLACKYNKNMLYLQQM